MVDSKFSVQNKWSTLGRIILSPELILVGLILIGIMASTYLLNVNLNAHMQLLVTGVVAVFAGLYGGLLTKRKADMVLNQTIQERGYASIRDLNHILTAVYSMKKRVSVFTQRLHQERSEDELTLSHFEELNDKCNGIFDQVMSVAENWQDVIPEANFKAQVANVYRLEKEISARMMDLLDLRSLSDKMDKETNQMERGKMQMTIEKMKTNLANLEAELEENKSKLLIDKNLYQVKDGQVFFSEIPEITHSQEKTKPLSKTRVLIQRASESRKLASNS